MALEFIDGHFYEITRDAEGNIIAQEGRDPGASGVWALQNGVIVKVSDASHVDITE